MPEVGPETILRRAAWVAWRMVEEEAVLVNARRDEVIQLDPVAAFIWSMFDGKATLREVAEDLTGEFDVDPETALADTLEFAGRLLEQGAAELAGVES